MPVQLGFGVSYKLRFAAEQASSVVETDSEQVAA
jgi:hypothetical protein